MAFGVCDNCFGYEIIGLTEEECKKKNLSFPCYSVFFDNVTIHDYFECSFDIVLKWCSVNRRNDTVTEIFIR